MKQHVLCRRYDSSYFEELTIEAWKEAEEESGSQSAFAETVLVTDGVCDNGMTEDEFLKYRNQ